MAGKGEPNRFTKHSFVFKVNVAINTEQPSSSRKQWSSTAALTPFQASLLAAWPSPMIETQAVVPGQVISTHASAENGSGSHHQWLSLVFWANLWWRNQKTRISGRISWCKMDSFTLYMPPGSHINFRLSGVFPNGDLKLEVSHDAGSKSHSRSNGTAKMGMESSHPQSQDLFIVTPIHCELTLGVLISYLSKSVRTSAKVRLELFKANIVLEPCDYMQRLGLCQRVFVVRVRKWEDWSWVWRAWQQSLQSPGN